MTDPIDLAVARAFDRTKAHPAIWPEELQQSHSERATAPFAEQVAQGHAYAARWKAGRREEVLTRAAIAANGLAPRPAVGTFPYPHRNCSEW